MLKSRISQRWLLRRSIFFFFSRGREKREATKGGRFQVVKIGYIEGKIVFLRKIASLMRELYRRLANYRKTRPGEIMRGKRISRLKKQEQVFGIYRFRN